MPAPAKDSSSLTLEIDVATSLALGRATTRAVCQISGEAQAAMLRALESEARMQESQGGPVGELVAALIGAYAEELK